MQLKAKWRIAQGVTLFAMVLVVITGVSFQGSAQAPSTVAGVQPNRLASGSPVNILANERVVINRLTWMPGQRSDPPGKTHPEKTPRDGIIVMLTPGEIEISSTGEKAETGHQEAGKIWWWPKPPATHSIANVGKEPFDFLMIHLQ